MSFIQPQFDSIPVELRSLPRWVTWRAEGASGEKPRKIPYAPDRPNTRASSTDEQTWGTFQQAEAAYLDGDRTGVGIVLNGDGLVGVDIDHCVTDGKPSSQAMAVLNQLGAAYIEISPSGTGLRAIGYGEQLEAGVNGSLDGLKAEFYSTGRYLTLTGKTLKSGPISVLKDFKAVADAFRTVKKTKVNQETGEIEHTAPDERHAALVARVLSGDVYHDSLRDLAASLVATGMQPGAVVNHLRGLMDNSAGLHDDRWQARRGEIANLVSSASRKFSPVVDFSPIFPQGVTEQIDPETGESTYWQESGEQWERPQPEPRYKLLGADALRNLPPLAWRVRGVLPAVGLAGLYGPSASGKSFLALDMAAAIAEGRRWFDCRVEAAPVVYAALEGEGGFRLRVAAWEAHTGRALPDGLSMVLQSFKLTEPQDIADLAAVVPAGAVVFLDTLNRAAPTADENSSKDMGEILSAAKLLQSLINGLVVLVHHTGKDATKGLRGHSSLFAALDAAVEVSRDGERREWKVAKSKDGQDGDAQPFKLQIETLGADDYGDAITSCVVVRDNAVQDVRAVKMPQGGNQKVVLEVVRDLLKKAGPFNTPGAPATCPPGRPAIELEESLSRIAERLTVAPDRKAERARESVTGLVSRGVLGCDKGWIWLV